jgi:hypothetical protein
LATKSYILHTFCIEKRAAASEMSQTSSTGVDRVSSSSSHPHIVKRINQALRDLEAVDGLSFVKLDLSNDGVLLRDEPAFDKLLSSPSRCPT